MSFSSWFQRRPRWQRITGAMVLAYLVAVPINLLLRLALRSWQWHPDILASALITSLMMPGIVLAQAAMERWSRN